MHIEEAGTRPASELPAHRKLANQVVLLLWHAKPHAQGSFTLYPKVRLRFTEPLLFGALVRLFERPHVLAEAGAEAGVTSEEAAPCGGSLPIATARSGKSLRGRLALRIRIVGRARRAIRSRDLDLHIPGQHQIGHEHGQGMLDSYGTERTNGTSPSSLRSSS